MQTYRCSLAVVIHSATSLGPLPLAQSLMFKMTKQHGSCCGGAKSRYSNSDLGDVRGSPRMGVTGPMGGVTGFSGGVTTTG